MTTSYRVFFKPSAEKEIRRVPKPDLERILDRIRRLSADPRPVGTRKMAGGERFRLRQGDWRILYAVYGTDRTVVIFKIGHRREVYR